LSEAKGMAIKMKFSSTEVNIAGMRINSIGEHCSVTFAQSEQRLIYCKLKRTEGFGEENGDANLHHHSAHMIDDEDFCDMFTAEKTEN